MLFLKHNLNASGDRLAAQSEDEIEKDISALIRDMNTSITEADKFIDSMSKPEESAWTASESGDGLESVPDDTSGTDFQIRPLPKLGTDLKSVPVPS
ncbi:MAG: DUF2959 family protein [Gammaproteobacteria bacterium]|nr:DUF2959 family protein [Gammaproteobacteria bacterium]